MLRKKSIHRLPYVLLCCVLGAEAAQVSVNTPNTALVLEVNKGAEPEYLYYGNTVTGEDMQSIKTAGRDCLTTKVRQSLFYTQNQKIQAAFAPPDIIFGQKFK